MAFRDLFRRRIVDQPQAAARLLPVNDDLEDRFELLPASMLDWAGEQFARIAAHEHPETGGRGPYPRPAAPIAVTDLAIPLGAALEALAATLAPFDAVLPPGDQPAHGVRAFGPDPLTAVVLGRSADGEHVGLVELILRSSDPDADLVLLAGLRALPAPEPLIVVDWQLRRAARLDDDGALRDFVADQA